MTKTQNSNHIVYVGGKPYMTIDSYGCHSPIDVPTMCGETIVIDWQLGNEIAKAKDPYMKNNISYNDSDKYVFVVTKIDSTSSFHGYAYMDPDRTITHVYFDVHGGWIVGKNHKQNCNNFPIIQLCGTTL